MFRPRSAAQRRVVSFLIAPLFLLLLCAFARAAAITVKCLSPLRTLSPRGLTTLAFRVTNLQSTTDTIELVVTLPKEFTVLVCRASVTLASGESKVILVSMLAQSTVPADSYEATFRATSTIEPTESTEAYATLTIEQRVAVKLSLPQGEQAQPGSQLTYKLSIVNDGNQSDTFQLEVQSRWHAVLSRDVVELAAGNKAEITLTVAIPAGVSPGDTDYCRITVRSRSDPTETATGTIRTKASPPLPEVVSGTLFPIVPGAVSTTTTWSNGSISIKGNARIGGTIAPGQSLSLGGQFDVGISKRLDLQQGWISYREADQSIAVSGISSAAPVSLDSVTIDYEYAPSDCPYFLKLHHETAKKSLNLSWRWECSSLGLDLTNKGWTISSSLSSRTVKMGLTVQESGFAFLLVPPRYEGLSCRGVLSMDSGKTTTFLSAAYGALGGSINLARSESTTETTCSCYSGVSLGSNAYVRTALEINDKQATDLDTINLKAFLSFSCSMCGLSSCLTAKFESSLDRLSKAKYDTLVVQGDASLNFGSGVVLFVDTTLSQELCTTGAATSSFNLGFSLPFGEYSWRGAFRSEIDSNGKRTASLSISAQGISLELTASSSSIALSLGSSFYAPLPLIKTKSQLIGSVFLDTNGNCEHGVGEEVIPGLVLGLADTQALTGKRGNFRFFPLSPGDYFLRIQNLPFRYVPLISMPIPIHLEAGMVKEVAIPIMRGAMVTGQVAVFSEEQVEELSIEGSGREASVVAGEGLAGILLKISSDDDIYYQVSNVDGRFQFDRLRPGHWTIKIYPDKLPRYYYLEQDTCDFDLGGGQEQDILVKVFVKRRIIHLLQQGTQTLHTEEKEDQE